jgi:hypothetical protein
VTGGDILDPWTALAGGTGTMLAVDGATTAAAQLGRITVWSGEDVAQRCEAPVPSPGRPRIAGGQVLWGELVLDGGGGAERVAGVHAALAEGTDAPAHSSPGNGFVPSAYAWAPDGARLAVAASWRRGAPRVVLLDRGGERRALLWEEEDLVPQALWAGSSRIVVGTRSPLVFRADGALENVLERGVPALRVEADAGESRLLIAEPGRITVWNADSWAPGARWPGAWLDAAIAPAGDLVLAVGGDRRLYAARVGGEPEPIDAPGPVQAVALDGARVVVALGDGHGIFSAAVRGIP